MAQYVVGLFDRVSDAQGAVRELRDSGFSAEDISIVANNAGGETTTTSGDGGTRAEEDAGFGAASGGVMGGLAGLLVGLGALAIPGVGPVIAAGSLASALGGAAVGAGLGAATGGLIGGLVGAGIPDEDAHVYAEGIRRGGTLVSVQTDDSNETNRAMDILNRYGVVDIDSRGQEYRQSGWTRFEEQAAPYSGTTSGTATQTGMSSGHTSGMVGTGLSSQTTMTSESGEVAIPVVEEELRIGKREVESGGVRVYTRVQETPVQEQVTLRDERVEVQRRAVDRPVSGADFANVREGTFEVRERDQEAVVQKQARVVEEVVINKEVGQRTETVQDTVRRTDVDVQQIPGETRTSGYTETSGTAMGGTGTGEGTIERGLSQAGNAVERATGLDVDRDRDVGQRDPRNNY